MIYVIIIGAIALILLGGIVTALHDLYKQIEDFKIRVLEIIDTPEKKEHREWLMHRRID